MDPTGLTPDERLTFVIGQIQRADVVIEEMLRGVWRLLAESLGTPGEPPRDFARLVKPLRSMIKEVGLAPEVQVDCLELLSASSLLHNRRNAIVHDRWMQDQRELKWSSVRYRRLEQSPPSLEMAEFIDCRVALTRMFWRVSALFETLLRHLSPDERGSERFRLIDLAIMADHFEMSESGRSITADGRLAFSLSEKIAES